MSDKKPKEGECGMKRTTGGVMGTHVRVVAVILSLLWGGGASALTCQSTSELMKYFFRYHISVHSFDKELSQKTFNNLIKYWDPGKMYFLQEDIDALRNKYENNLDQIVQKQNCQGIDEIYNVYTKRVSEVYTQLKPLIETTQFDFSVDEKMNVDRKKMLFPKTMKESMDRWVQRIKFQFLQRKKTVKSDSENRKKLLHQYVLLQKRQKEITTTEIYEAALESFASAADEHSAYYSDSQMEEFSIASRLSLDGIGALLRQEDGIISVESLLPGGVAQKSGLLHVNDSIVAVAQGKGVPVDVIDMDLRDAVKLIRGPKGTEVRLTVRRQGKEVVVPLLRDSVELKDSEAKMQTYEVELKGQDKTPRTMKISVIDLPSFYMDFEGRQAKKKDFRSSSRDIENLLKRVNQEKVDAVVLDIRVNGGGSLDEAINVSGKFLGAGPMVQTKSAGDKPYASRYEENAVYTGPLVVIIDRQSASASEILAGAIKDYNRGVVVGSLHTFGKGTVQVLNDLSDMSKEAVQSLHVSPGEKLGAVKVTVSKFFRPHGESTQLRGVPSDIRLPNISDHAEVGEEFYEYPVAWESVPPVPHQDFGYTEKYLDILRKNSQERVLKSKDFKEMQALIDDYEKKKSERYLVSLKEKTKKEITEEENKEKEAKAKAKKEKENNLGSTVDNDIVLREAVNIATDYALMLGKQAPQEIGNIKMILVK
jgi:carboxyl-terminal processing protease